MTKEFALNIVKEALKTVNKKNELQIKDSLQFNIAITVLHQSYTPKQLKKLLKRKE